MDTVKKLKIFFLLGLQIRYKNSLYIWGSLRKKLVAVKLDRHLLRSLYPI